MADFILETKYVPTGDQPKAIDALVDGINQGKREQVLKGVTGSGKTFTMANVIKRVGKKTIVLEPNKGARVIDYTEFAPGDGAFVIDTEGYAFMFVYKDGAGVGSALSGSYVVRDGDTLNKIAASLGTNASSLASINGIKNPNYICVGQVIRY